MGWIRQRWLYWFDNTMARGTFALVGWLAVICLVTDIPISVLLVTVHERGRATLGTHLIEIWKMIGSTFKVGGQVGPPVYVLASVASAVVALLFASTLVSLITAGVNKKIMDLRKGRSVVLETGHIAVIGWSAEVFSIAAELKASGARHGRKMLAVLADRDKAGMEDEIRARVHGVRVVCRSGSPVVPVDIDRINPGATHCLLVLAEPGEDADEQVIKSMLAIRNKTPGSRIVAAIANHDNLAAAAKAGGGNAELLDADDLASRWIAQAALQPGLATVFSELLRFNGNEFCTFAVSSVTQLELAGSTFGDVLHAFETASPVGLCRADGTLLLNPPSDEVVAADDTIVAISARDVFSPGGPPQIDEDAIVLAKPRRRDPLRLLILGWNRRAPQVIRQLDAYVPAGSRIDIMTDEVCAIEKLRTDLSRAEIGLRSGDPTDFDLLSSLDLAGYQHIIMLSADGGGDSQSDFRSLVTLLHLRGLEAKLGRPLGITGEIADDHTLALAPSPYGDAPTFLEQGIVTRTMVSQLMTQAATNAGIVPIFTELFDPEGTEIFLRPAMDYVLPDRTITFATVVESARRQSQVAIGYRLAASRSTHLNPDRRAPLTLTPSDQVIVLAPS
jgi:Castor and Pollux, part of voltage-gated ion channel